MTIQRAIEIIKEILPDVDDETAEYIAWEETGFPAFWAIPTDGATPEECFRKQVHEFAQAVSD